MRYIHQMHYFSRLIAPVPAPAGQGVWVSWANFGSPLLALTSGRVIGGARRSGRAGRDRGGAPRAPLPLTRLRMATYSPKLVEVRCSKKFGRWSFAECLATGRMRSGPS